MEIKVCRLPVSRRARKRV